MISLHEDEKILLVIRKHWFVMARTVVFFVILLILPSLILSILPFLTSNLNQETVAAVANFSLSLYILLLLVFLFLFWMDYYLDMWIITNYRIIDVEQNGLFSRTIAEIPLRQVQDVTIEIKGIIETFLKFGTMRIQTAGEREFKIQSAPNIYEAKNIILENAHLGAEKR